MAFLDYPQGNPVNGILRYAGGLYAKAGKRTFDLTLALGLLPLIAPVIALFWLCAAAQGSGGFYAHRRVGQNGRAFSCWKIRTMIPDADALLPALLQAHPDRAKSWSTRQKLAQDPRVTAFGGFLRWTSLDELPQIWNVLKGDMSFVGPRPVTTDELKHYGDNLDRYLSVRPGITGLWQVNGRQCGCYAKRVVLDCTYANEFSFSGDVWLLIKTLPVLIRPTGR